MGSSHQYEFYFIHHPPNIDLPDSPFLSIGAIAAKVLDDRAKMIDHGTTSSPATMSFKTATDYLKERTDDELDPECLSQLRDSHTRIGSDMDEEALYRDAGKPYYGRPIWNFT
jgi:hypothetical protein